MTQEIENQSHLESTTRNPLFLRVTASTPKEPKQQVAELLAELPGIPAVLHGASTHGGNTSVFVEIYPDTVLAAGEFILRLGEIGDLAVLLEPGTESAPLRSQHLFAAASPEARLQTT